MKPHLDLDAQVALLEKRGLEISISLDLSQFLKDHNYYRLRGYFHPFLETETDISSSGKFSAGTTGQVIKDLVEFDRRLRNLLFEALAVFETRFRASLAYHAGKVNPFIHLEGPGTVAEFDAHSEQGSGESQRDLWVKGYNSTLEKHKKNDIVRWHIDRYDGRIPIWAAVELLDFGKISKLYRSLEECVASQIASDFGGGAIFVKSMVATLNDLRNHVAHHSRIWNFHYPVAPIANYSKLPTKLHHLASLSDYERHKLFTRLSLLMFLDSERDFAINFTNRLLDILLALPRSDSLSPMSMGMADGFRQSELWISYFLRNGF